MMRVGVSRMFRRLAKALTGACIALAVAACGTQGAPASSAEHETPNVMETIEYSMGPGDELRIVVFGQSQLTGQFVVGANGAVDYPLIGDVVAAGLTVDQFSEALGEALRQGYVRNPNINVEVTKYRPFYILGEVGEPGTYPFSAGLTVMRAVATAGGFTYRANSRVVYIQHSDEVNEREYRLTSMTLVEPGDTVRIPERRF